MGDVIHITADILRRQAGEALRELAAPYEDRVWQHVSGLGEKDHGKAAIGQESGSVIPFRRASLRRGGDSGAPSAGHGAGATVHETSATGPAPGCGLD
jgi:hypothetical protein